MPPPHPQSGIGHIRLPDGRGEQHGKLAFPGDGQNVATGVDGTAHVASKGLGWMKIRPDEVSNEDAGLLAVPYLSGQPALLP